MLRNHVGNESTFIRIFYFLKLTYRKNYGFQFLMAKDELILN